MIKLFKCNAVKYCILIIIVPKVPIYRILKTKKRAIHQLNKIPIESSDKSIQQIW